MNKFNYIEAQLSAVRGNGQTRIKISTESETGLNQTNWLSITKEQLAMIECALATPRLVCSPDWADFAEESKREPDLTWGQYCERFKLLENENED